MDQEARSRPSPCPIPARVVGFRGLALACSRPRVRQTLQPGGPTTAQGESIRDTIGTAIQVNLSMVTIEESEITKRLAAWATIVAVVLAPAGIWGMNFSHMPDLNF